jgi:hypothetical protein
MRVPRRSRVPGRRVDTSVLANKPTRFQWLAPNRCRFELLRWLFEPVHLILDPVRKRLNLYHVAHA